MVAKMTKLKLQLASLTLIAAGFSFLAATANPALGQDLNGDDLFLTGGVTNQPDIFFNENDIRHSICMRSNFLTFVLENDDETANNRVFELNNNAPNRAAGVFGNGFGIGTADPTSPLHIFSTNSSPYPEAKIFVENSSTPAELREMIRLENNGGVGINLVDNDTSTFFKMENVLGKFELASGPVHFRVTADSSNNSLNLGTMGVGIGTSSPTSTLHIQADNDDALESSFGSSTITTETKGGTAQSRVLLNCINNGPTVVSMTDTNRPSFSQWLITNTVFGDVDALSLRKNAAGAPNFTIFEDGNIRFTFNGTPNCTIKPNGDLFVRGSVLSNSDRNLKENIKPVDPEEILTKVVQLPITTWNYNYDQDAIPHMGPMAQDFYQAFRLGVDDKTIASMDKDGVALAAIQGLNRKMESKDEKITELSENLKKQTEKIAGQSELIAEQSELISELTQRLERLEALVVPTQK
jgi:hypothetical protein